MTDEEKKPYHTAMLASWRIFIKERKTERFSNEWWKEIIGEFNSLRESYVGTPLRDYVDYMNQAFLDEWERIQNRDRQKGISETVLPETEEYRQEELQFSDPVPKVDGSKEADEEFTSADWG